MMRREQYCDHCGTKMTYQDSDNETGTNGLILTGAPVANIYQDTGCGSRSMRVNTYHTDFCGIDCFEEAMTAFMKAVRKAVTNE